MSPRDPAPRPDWMRAVRADDELLARLGARRSDPTPTQDAVTALLAALAADVDRHLPTDIEDFATRALAGAHAASASGYPEPAPDETVSLMRPERRVVTVKRSTSLLVAAAMVFGTASVAAAVTGDPAGAFGVRAIVHLFTGAKDPTSAPATTKSRQKASLSQQQADLTRRLREQGQRSTGPDATQVARLRQLARTLPDGGGRDVQALLAVLAARLGPSGGSHGSGNASARPTHASPAPAHTGAPTDRGTGPASKTTTKATDNHSSGRRSRAASGSSESSESSSPESSSTSSKKSATKTATKGSGRARR